MERTCHLCTHHLSTANHTYANHTVRRAGRNSHRQTKNIATANAPVGASTPWSEHAAFAYISTGQQPHTRQPHSSPRGTQLPPANLNYPTAHAPVGASTPWSEHTAYECIAPTQLTTHTPTTQFAARGASPTDKLKTSPPQTLRWEPPPRGANMPLLHTYRQDS